MALAVRFHRAQDPDAVAVGSLAFAKLVELFQQVDAPVPEHPEPDVFMKLWAMEQIILLGLWDGEHIVGFQCHVLSPSLLGSRLMQSHHLGSWITEKHRGANNIALLREAADQVLRSKGVKVISVNVAPDSVGHQITREVGFRFPMLAGYRRL